MILAGILLGSPSARTQPTSSPTPEPTYNIARSAVGTTLFYLDPQGSPLGVPTHVLQTPTVLVGDDEVLSYELRSGRSLMVIELPASAPARYLTFFNFDARGEATASWASTRSDADAGRWTSVPKIAFDSQGPTTIPLPEAQTFQFLRIQFDITQPGRISGLGIAGHYPNAAAPSPTNLVKKDDPELPLSNVVSYGSLSSVIGTSPIVGQNVETMIDDLTDTFTDLNPSRNPRAVLIDLGEAREIRQVSVLADSPPGNVKVFFLSDPETLAATIGSPAQGSSTTPIVLSSIDLPRLEREIPFITLPLQPGQNGVTLPIQPRTGRFALLVWPPGTEKIRIYEINLLGRYEWAWDIDRPGAPAEGFQIPPGAFSPPVPGTPPPNLTNTPLSP
ncbi:MAG: hypothetical protein OHK005_12220 [Candidatus Methylacidiphilales bacterium]